MSFGFVTVLRDNRAKEIRDLIDAGSAGGKCNFYDGTRPATGAAITTQTLLAELVFSTVSFPDPSSGVLTANSITGDSSGNDTGTTTWARIFDSDDNFVTDCNVGTSGSDINLSSVAIAPGIAVDITSFIFTEGNA